MRFSRERNPIDRRTLFRRGSNSTFPRWTTTQKKRTVREISILRVCNDCLRSGRLDGGGGEWHALTEREEGALCRGALRATKLRGPHEWTPGLAP